MTPSRTAHSAARSGRKPARSCRRSGRGRREPSARRAGYRSGAWPRIVTVRRPGTPAPAAVAARLSRRWEIRSPRRSPGTASLAPGHSCACLRHLTSPFQCMQGSRQAGRAWRNGVSPFASVHGGRERWKPALPVGDRTSGIRRRSPRSPPAFRNSVRKVSARGSGDLLVARDLGHELGDVVGVDAGDDVRRHHPLAEARLVGFAARVGQAAVGDGVRPRPTRRA